MEKASENEAQSKPSWILGRLVVKPWVNVGKCFMLLNKDWRRFYETNDLMMFGGEATVDGVGGGLTQTDLAL